MGNPWGMLGLSYGEELMRFRKWEVKGTFDYNERRAHHTIYKIHTKGSLPAASECLYRYSAVIYVTISLPLRTSTSVFLVVLLPGDWSGINRLRRRQELVGEFHLHHR